jgi:hypothetical protein
VPVEHSTHVFEQEPIPPNTEPTLAIDIAHKISAEILGHPIIEALIHGRVGMGITSTKQC